MKLKDAIGIDRYLPYAAWKEKNLDYEIETVRCLTVRVGGVLAWKEKNLDYEIETNRDAGDRNYPSPLEKKRTSITRLKPKTSSHQTWIGVSLEKKRTSITRLKLRTCRRAHPLYLKTWKEKNLDYEIETSSSRRVNGSFIGYLKRKEPRLRDWNKNALTTAA